MKPEKRGGNELMQRAVIVVAVVIAGVQALAARQSGRDTPPIPFEDAGACPIGEGCTYREWTANAPVVIRTERRNNAPVAYRVRTGEQVTALTGIVVIVKPGRVQFRERASLESPAGPIQIAPGESLYLLTYQGEGFTKAWFKGRFYTDVDVADYVSGACEEKASRCAGKLVDRPQTVWWVRMRNRLGLEGWTREVEKFDGKDALA